MSYREQIRRMRHQFHKDVTELQAGQVEMEGRIDARLEQQQKLMDAIRLQLLATADQMGALAEHNQSLRNEFKDQSRTLSGRMRLMEERLSIFMEIMETQNGQLDERVSRLEQRSA